MLEALGPAGCGSPRRGTISTNPAIRFRAIKLYAAQGAAQWVPTTVFDLQGGPARPVSPGRSRRRGQRTQPFRRAAVAWYVRHDDAELARQLGDVAACSGTPEAPGPPPVTSPGVWPCASFGVMDVLTATRTVWDVRSFEGGLCSWEAFDDG